MSKAVFTINRFDGGWSSDIKLGNPNSFSYSRHVDFRKSPTALTILPRTVKESASAVDGLILDMIRLPSGKILGVSKQGVFSRATNGTWTKLASISSTPAIGQLGTGMVYERTQDRIYFPGSLDTGPTGQNAMHAIYDADTLFSGGTTTFKAGSVFGFIDNQASDHTNAYTTLSSLSEAGVDKFTFTPNYEPTNRVNIWITTKGSGNITLTLHDAHHNNLATATVAASGATNGAQLPVTLSNGDVRNTVKPNASDYHVHAYHSSGTAWTLGVATASDFSTAWYTRWVNRFVEPVDFHPAINFLQYALFGNERYIMAWEIISEPETNADGGAGQPTPLELQQHRVVLEKDYVSTSFALWGEYVATGAGKFSTTAGDEMDSGRLYLWDGVSSGWNTAIDVPAGSPYSLFSEQSILYYLAGAGLWAWAGGQPVKVRQMPGTDSEFTAVNIYFRNAPHMMAVRNDILMVGFPTDSNSTTVERGVYSFGARNKDFDASFGLSYTISTGTLTGTTLQIGCVKSFGSKLFISWRDNTTFGVDVVDANSAPYADATWESLIYDFGRIDKQKEAVDLLVTFESLPTGATITPKFKIDREASWENADASLGQGVAGQTQIRIPIGKRFYEIQLAIDFVATTVTPKVTSVNLKIETLQSEAD